MLSFINKNLHKPKKDNYFIIFVLIVINLSSSKIISNSLESNNLCSITTYDNKSVTEECFNGPRKETRIIEYSTYEQYISSRNYRHNGLSFYSSLYVDTEYHNISDFMDRGMLIIILFIIALILLLSWIPLIFCWRYRVCLFNECCIDTKCGFITCNIIAYILFAAILSFIIVCIIFAQ